MACALQTAELLEFLDVGDDAVIVVAHPREVAGGDWPEEAATLITFRDGKVVDMQDYRTLDEAVSARGSRT